MLTIREVIRDIEEAKLKRDIMNELTPANKKFLARRNGTFEAVLTGKGPEKCLIPEVGVLHFLYRGQNEEVAPCVPSIYRGNPSEEQIFANRMRLVLFRRLLKSHPVVTKFFERHHFLVNSEGLAQHYGVKTEVLDLTSNLDVALFFATCKYDRDTDSYDYYRNGGVHEGVLYVFDPVRDNEPSPPLHFEKYMNGNITPIGLQAFPRPGAQYGYGLRIGKGGSTKSWMYKFSFTSEDSKRYYDMFQAGEALWIKDRLIPKTKEIAERTCFSYSVFKEAYELFKPKGFSKNQLKAALDAVGVELKQKYEDIVFSKEEQLEIIEEWNTTLGKQTCEKIVRKYWFEHDGIDEPKDGKWGTVRGMRNRQEYNTMKHISELMLINMIVSPDGPTGAEWRNYTNTPRPKEKSRPDDGTWKKMGGRMESVFGKPYLTEEDWWIDA